MNNRKFPSAVQVVSPDFTLYPDTHKHLFVPRRHDIQHYVDYHSHSSHLDILPLRLKV